MKKKMIVVLVVMVMLIVMVIPVMAVGPPPSDLYPGYSDRGSAGNHSIQGCVNSMSKSGGKTNYDQWWIWHPR